MLDMLNKLCSLNGTSGREETVRSFIISQIKDKCELSVDKMGNIIAFKKGKSKPKNKVSFTAHMDEVGFIVTNITNDGFLRFAPVGGVDSKVVAGRRVIVGDKEINGVVGIKPIHLTDKSDANTVPDFSKLYIDIGADSKSQAEEYVSLGDSVYFTANFEAINGGKIKSKAIDDRFGCAVMIDLINSELEFDTYFCFLVQEEVGLRGAGAAMYAVEPDYAIVLEATTAADVAGVSQYDTVCNLDSGAVVSFMDRSTVYNRDLYKKAFSYAKENGIKIQTKTTVAGGNDAGVIHKSNGGVYTLTVSLPCRYIHSGTSVASIDDMKSCRALAQGLFEVFAND